MVQRLFARVCFLSFVYAAAFYEVRIDRNFDFQNVHSVLGLGVLLHALGNDLRFLLGVLQTFFVAALGIVTDEFKEERNLVGLALCADTLDKSMLNIVHLSVVER